MGTAIIGLLAGLMIGCVGIGGVIVVPALVYALGIPIQTAIAAAMMGYIPTGLIGAIIYARKKSFRWELAGWICAGAIPAAFFGAWIGNVLDAQLLELGVGLLGISSGIYILLGSHSSGTEPEPSSRTVLVVMGVVTGTLSALTGTSGPLVLMPILFWCRFPVLVAIGLSQAIQIPIAILATAGNLVYGEADIRMGILLGICLMIGTWQGAQIAHQVPHTMLERIAAVVLLVVGTLIIGKLAYFQFA